jgi:hypothetical protein
MSLDTPKIRPRFLRLMMTLDGSNRSRNAQYIYFSNSVLSATNNYHSEPDRESRRHSSIASNPSGFP